MQIRRTAGCWAMVFPMSIGVPQPWPSPFPTSTLGRTATRWTLETHARWGIIHSKHLLFLGASKVRGQVLVNSPRTLPSFPRCAMLDMVFVPSMMRCGMIWVCRNRAMADQSPQNPYDGKDNWNHPKIAKFFNKYTYKYIYHCNLFQQSIVICPE